MLQKEEDVSKLKIYKYNFDPSIHFAITGDKMLFGIYWPSPKHPGARFINFFIVGNDSPGGSQLISDCEEYFEKVANMPETKEINVN